MTEKEREAFIKLLEVLNKFMQLTTTSLNVWSSEYNEMLQLRKELLEAYEVLQTRHAPPQFDTPL